MKQSRTMSLIESCVNVAVGYGVAVISQLLVFPLFGINASLRDNLLIGLAFTVISIARSFALRRVFEAVRVRERRAAAVSSLGSNPRVALVNYLAHREHAEYEAAMARVAELDIEIAGYAGARGKTPSQQGGSSV